MSSTQDQQQWNLCLQSRQYGRKIINVSNTITLSELYQIAEQQFSPSTTNDSGIVIKGGGFPPKTLARDEGTIISSVLGNQERLQVDFVSQAGSGAAAGSKKSSAKKKTNSTSKKSKGKGQTLGSSAADDDDDDDVASNPNGTTRQRSQRAAAKAATEAMPDVIKAQDAMMRQQPRKRSSPSASSRSRPTPINRSNTNIANNKNGPKRVRLSASAGAGRRLADGATVGAPAVSSSGSSRSRSRQGPLSSLANKNSSSDISEALMNSIQDPGKMGSVLRKGMKNAVQASYETSKAFSRLSAIQSKSYEMSTVGTESNSISNSASSNGKLKVVFQGTVDKTRVEEIVDLIPQDVLATVVRGIYDSGSANSSENDTESTREALRPENLARLSPRVLWSCAYHFGDTDGSGNENNIIDMYRALLPDCDWSFLRRRATQLSAKARENQRQQQQEEEERLRQNGVGADGDAVDMGRAVEAIHAVEDAMEQLHDSQVLERQARIAQAAEARLRRQERQQDEAGRWSLVTPSEPDRDELRECIESSIPSELLLEDSNSGGGAAAGDNESRMIANTSKLTAWITTLMRDCQIHNWRELAMVQDDDVVSRIASKLSSGNDENELKQHVLSWIDHAQGESVGEIMVEICDGNVAAVWKIEERARSCTPKDLASWRAIPDMLLGRLEQEKDDQEEEDGTVDLQMLTTWCDRSYNLLQEPQYAWLSWFATSV